MNHMQPKRSLVFYLTLLNSILVLLVSLCGILVQQMYAARQNSITVHELLGQDIVNFIVGALLLAVVLVDQKERIKPKLVWLGCLLYFIYIYGYFCFGLMVTPLYLVYVAIFGLSLFSFILLMVDIAKRPNAVAIKPNYMRRSISILFFVCAGIMTVIEVKDLIVKTVLEPGGVTPYDAYYIFDLGLIFPAMLVIGIMNWKKQVWGYLLAGVMLIKIITLLPALIISDVLHKLYVGYFRDIGFDMIALTITLAAAILFLFYLHRIEED
jgi:hypothetical protein